jgi:NAD(P)-dependent dehydrogenase (short-subunit alcohol dehydrogenase family)
MNMQAKTAQGTTAPRVAVITGASSGIGLAAAKALAAQGWRIIGQGRDPERLAAAESAIKASAASGAGVEMIRGELSLLAGAARLADEIAARSGRIDALLNNAGGTAKEQVITAEGNEATFTGNHLGHFVLTNRLLPLLKSTAAQSPRGAVRIINVSSAAHEVSKGLDWDDLQMFKNFVPIKAYCNVKLANLLFTRALARRLTDAGIVVHAMHPGAVDTNFVNRADQGTQRYMRTQNLLTSEQGADTLIWLAGAAQPGESTGQYFHDRAPVPSSAAANDAAAAERLWRESEQLAAASTRR